MGANLEGDPVYHIWGLNRWVHQIDFIDDDLAVVDTLRNRILVYPDIDSLSSRHCSVNRRIIAPAATGRKGRLSPHYRHFNSIYRHGGKIYVVAHNHSIVTGKESEIWVFDSAWRLLGILKTGGNCCHNVVSHEEGLITNHSLEQTVLLDGREVARVKGFNRGIAYDGEYILIGGSVFAKEYAQRDNDDGYIEVFDRRFEPVGRIVLPRCSMRDVRFLNNDRGLSNHPGR
ncbi:hypothetical protein [Micromonospora sp. C95]|uniref:hypothetical protein n=1 Tax=Micromonospora sp. C95 TaxID=2824882 RepID=UPI001B38B545|nr:hypothetical protein [Micromonospora sp. C95]MBQ1026185.1 hypothetical protein [Micromonospora sp. C95]